MEKTSMFQEPAFRRIVVGSTAIGFSAMLASLAALRIGKTVGLQFVWHWSILVVIAATVFWNWRFWNTVWELQDRPQPNTQRKLGWHVAALIALGLGSFLYPIRFIEHSYLGGIGLGLGTAVAFLGTLAWLVFKAGKILSEIDAAEIARVERQSAESANA